MLKALTKIASCLICLAALTGLRCQQTLLEPASGIPGGAFSEITFAGEDQAGNPDETGDPECRLQVNRADSTLSVDLEDLREKSAWVWDNIVRIEFQVTLGLAEGGMVLADTSGYISLEDMGKTTRVPVRLAGPVPAGKNQVVITSVMRYLDGYGHLALPTHKSSFYCFLIW